ncbi:MAG: (Fe-S)-binding protein [Bacteroidales bacterium]|nr:(Fe-S)-binding protein [Candidatus Cryptobacteroides choladohippi]
MIDRIASGFHPFVLPFLAGMFFVFGYCIYGILKILLQLPREDRLQFYKSLITPETAVKNVKDIFLNCLLHVKLWKRNPMLGFMHSSIAFGWFMLIVLGHVEVILFVPERIKFFYYPIFFNYFVAEADSTVKGSVLFFLMDFFLLVVLVGIALAVIKRFRSLIFGMRRTTRPSFLDLIGQYALWAIFPLRWLAEGFTAHISGGSFMTIPLNWMARQFLGNEFNMLPTWWAYSIALGVFMFVLPFTRYMHIPAEMLLIPMRNAGLRIRHARRGFARAEIFSCPSCGVCIDACPMSVKKANLKDCTVYLNRHIRRGHEKRVDEISDKCLLCGKCQAVCQVGVEGPTLRMAQRATRRYSIEQDYSGIDTRPLADAARGSKVLYFAGCMTQLTPRIPRAVESVLKKAGVNYVWMDRDGGLCCGRPMLTAGKIGEAKQLIRKNEQIISESRAHTLILSCPICYKIFREHYSLPGVRVIHHSQYFDELVRLGKLSPVKGSGSVVWHDPCELGRGSGIYEAPRDLLGRCAELREAGHNHAESICCGGSLGSLTLGFAQREAMTRNALDDLVKDAPDAIATGCPLCMSTFGRYADRPVKDIAEILDESC